MTGERGSTADQAGPDPNVEPCADCGHVWFAGERQHEYFRGSPELPDETLVLCALCHHKRVLGRPRPHPPE
ncbi:MAG: hypothetical protein ACYC91_16200 [Solirubrobacteraceae bacterium]